jgi:4-aminobutyrate aminotransferase-like enzyme/Ser/Thr protein kinase RdoA (MazF antagonist)
MRERVVTAPYPTSDAVRLALEAWGLEVTAVRGLPGEYDDNFRLTCADGSERVLKVMHPEREPFFVDMQCRALLHLAQRMPDVDLPRVQPAHDGSPLVSTPGPEGAERLAWLLSYVPGSTLALARPRAPSLLEGLGRLLGRMDGSFLDFDHPQAHRDFKWDLSRAGWIRDALGEIAGPPRRERIESFLNLYESEVVPRLPSLRRSVIHGDANDHNVLVGDPRELPRRVVAVIDFGDMHYGLTVSEPAIAAAYALLGQPDPIEAAAEVVRGYHAELPLDETEIALLYPLIAARLAVSVANSALRRRLKPDDPYVTISEAPAWEALERLARVPPRLAHYRFRAACGLTPVPGGPAVAAWLAGQHGRVAPVLEQDLGREPVLVLDLGVGSRLLGADPRAAETAPLSRTIVDAMQQAGVAVGVGRYAEARAFYTTPQFSGGARLTDEHRTIHLGIDLFVRPGTPIHAPLDGVVHLAVNNAARLDYGPLVILRHETGAGDPFFTLFGHLSEETLAGLQVGQSIARGQRLGCVGAPPVNGDWPPHVHVQVILDLLDLGRDFPGVAYASQLPVWTALSPDPNLLLGIPEARLADGSPTKTATLSERRERLGRNLSVSYQQPLKIVRGFLQHLYDETARAYLDLYNNVPLVGHSHPRVIAAVQAQIGLLNTNTRYLHDNIVRYAERLTAKLPPPLRVCYFLSSGSEANELALRLARARTRRREVIVLEHAYHGHTTTLVDVSPYKFEGPGGEGRRDWVRVAPLPDDYRGPYRRDDPRAGEKYARHVAEIVEALRAAGGGPAAFLAETLPSVAGQIVPPPGYLSEAYRHVRAAGGVCIADEVQTGFGRLGSCFWGFELQGVVPDVVVMGKPIGNGFPLAAVVTTPEIAAAFDNGMEFFSTFGGNPVACAAGLAVLDVLEDERLQQNARRVGDRLKASLERLAERHALIGDVRGSGLFLGVELVRDRATRAAATRETSYVVERLRERGVLTGSDGPFENVLKLRPPLVLTPADADLFIETLDAVLAEDAARPPEAIE